MKNVLIFIFLLFFQFVFAQKKDENIGTEVVNVVKQYSPTISDAFKIKDIPQENDTLSNPKETVIYKIFSFPVASTFTPSKGIASGVTKAKKEKLYPNYASVGFGNYLTANAELFINYDIDNYQYVGGMIQHKSSQGGIKNVILNDAYMQNNATVFYGYERTDTKYNANLSFKNEGYNWYGIPLENPNFNSSSITNINPLHIYTGINFDGEVAVTDTFFDKLTLQYNSFKDNYESTENQFVIRPIFNFDFGKTKVKTIVTIDYLNNTFLNSYQTIVPTTGTDYSNQKSTLIASICPSFIYLNDDLSVEVGAETTFLSRIKSTYNGMDTNTGNKFFIYPKVSASYNVVGNSMIAFGGVEGKLVQNTYANFVNENKFLSPTQIIDPTNQQFDAFVGLQGKLTNTLGYTIKASFASVNNMPLFKSNVYVLAPVNNYSIGNSYSVVYDDVKSVQYSGELKADINKDISLQLQATVSDYKTTFEAKAWNKPILEASFMANFNITQKWFAGTQLFYVGERFDAFTDTSLSPFPISVQTLNAYFDINLQIGYKYNERITAFLKGNNLANQSYEKWLNYPVQGAQILLGGSYKFDF